MPFTAPVPSVTAITDRLPSITTDLLVVPVFDGDPFDDLAGVREASGGAIDRAMADGEFRARPFDMFLTGLSGWAAPRILLVGAGTRA